MALFQGVELRVSSGDAGTTMMIVERLQTVSVGGDIARSPIKALNRFRPEVNMPVINYTPVPLSFDIIKGDNILETAFGLTNPTGVLVGITDSKNLLHYGVRNFEIHQCPLNATNYVGQFNISSGVLTNYSIGVTVGDVAKASYAFQNFDLGWAPNNSAKTGVNYNSTVVRGQDASISGIDISGFGISGFTPQSVNIGISISRTEVSQIGSKFPVSRSIVDATATIQIQGFLEAGNTTLTGLGTFDCGTPVNGSFYVFLTPSCQNGPATTYRAVNPYLQSIHFTNSVGNFSAVEVNLTIPLPYSALETGSASNLIIS